MKKVIFVFILMAITWFTGFTQKPSTFFKTGLNLANVSINNNGNIDEANMLLSLQVGITSDIPISSFFSIQTGIIITGKGAKTQTGNTTDANYYRATTNPWYVEIPVNFVLKAPIENGVKFITGVGPYVAIGVAGKRKAEGKVLGVGFNRIDNIQFSNDDPTTSGEEGAGFGILKRFDYGLNGTIGIEGNRTMFSVNYGLGLAKLQSGTNSSSDNNNKHRVLSFIIGFKL